MRHSTVSSDPRPHQLCEAADVDVFGELGAGPDLHERSAVRAIANPRVLYMGVRADAAFESDLRVALDDGERLYRRVLADAHGRVDERGVRVDDGDALLHQAIEDSPLEDARGGGQANAVLDAHRLVGIGEPHDVDRLQGKEDVGEVVL